MQLKGAGRIALAFLQLLPLIGQVSAVEINVNDEGEPDKQPSFRIQDSRKDSADLIAIRQTQLKAPPARPPGT